MNRNAKKAFTALKAIGCPVFEREGESSHFCISAEDNTKEIWADYYEGCRMLGFSFGISPKITAILNAHSLFAEWDDPGSLSVFDA